MPHQRSQWGFTLIELLMVMVIIGIVAGTAVIMMASNQNKSLETFANQLVSWIRLAEQEAMLRPVTLGLRIQSHTIRFYEYQPDAVSNEYHWVATQQAALRPRRIPDSIDVTWKNKPALESASESTHPQMILLPTGNITPMVMLISKKHDAPRYRVIGKQNGDVKSEWIDAN